MRFLFLSALIASVYSQDLIRILFFSGISDDASSDCHTTDILPNLDPTIFADVDLAPMDTTNPPTQAQYQEWATQYDIFWWSGSTYTYRFGDYAPEFYQELLTNLNQVTFTTGYSVYGSSAVYDSDIQAFNNWSSPFVDGAFTDYDYVYCGGDSYPWATQGAMIVDNSIVSFDGTSTYSDSVFPAVPTTVGFDWGSQCSLEDGGDPEPFHYFELCEGVPVEECFKADWEVPLIVHLYDDHHYAPLFAFSQTNGGTAGYSASTSCHDSDQRSWDSAWYAALQEMLIALVDQSTSSNECTAATSLSLGDTADSIISITHGMDGGYHLRNGTCVWTITDASTSFTAGYTVAVTTLNIAAVASLTIAWTFTDPDVAAGNTAISATGDLTVPSGVEEVTITFTSTDDLTGSIDVATFEDGFSLTLERVEEDAEDDDDWSSAGAVTRSFALLISTFVFCLLF